MQKNVFNLNFEFLFLLILKQIKTFLWLLKVLWPWALCLLSLMREALSPLLTSCATMGKLLNLSGPEFPPL